MDVSWLCVVAVFLILIPVIYYGITSRWNYGKQLLKAQQTGTSRARKFTKTMNSQHERKPKNIVIWRDSVAAGDDAFAPHEITIEVNYEESIERTLEKIVATRYLPSIQGGKATWVAVGKDPVAVIAQQWSKPYFFVETGTHTKDLIEFTQDHQLEFRYWCQIDPMEVAASIEQGKPWPDKYGRDHRINQP